MDSNRLKNPLKTELILFSTRQGVNKFTRATVGVGSTYTSPVNHVKSLGVTLNNQLKLSKHVSNVTRLCFYQIRQLKHTGRYLDFQSVATFVHLFVISRVDLQRITSGSTSEADEPTTESPQCSCPLAASSFSLRLQSTRESQRSAPLARMPERVTFKLSTTVYNCLHGIAPGYLNELCVPVRADAYRNHLRSADKMELKVPRHKLSTYGPRAGKRVPLSWSTLAQSSGTLSPAIFRMRS